jgi:hypothetical protein
MLHKHYAAIVSSASTDAADTIEATFSGMINGGAEQQNAG